MIFVPVSCKHVDNFSFHSGLTSSRAVSCKRGLSIDYCVYIITVRVVLPLHTNYGVWHSGCKSVRYAKFTIVLSPFSTRRICSREAKIKSWQCDWSAKKIAAKKLNQFLLFYCSREQIRLVENGLNSGNVA